MATLITLEEDILHLICEHLDLAALKSASLAHRTLSQVYKRYCCRHLSISTSAEKQDKIIGLLNRWNDGDNLKHVHHLTIIDTSETSQQGAQLLFTLVEDIIPQLKGLKTVTWRVARNASWQLSTLCIQGLAGYGFASNVEVSVNYHDKMGYPPGPESKLGNTRLGSILSSLETLLMGAPALSNLVSLDVEVTYWKSGINQHLKTMLLGASQLRILRLKIDTDAEGDPKFDWWGVTTSWTPQEVAAFPMLEVLEFDDGGFFNINSLSIWAEHGHWDCIKTLKVDSAAMLKYMIGKTPRLASLTADFLSPWLLSFIAQAPKLESLSFTSLAQAAPSVPRDWTALHNDAILTRDTYCYYNLFTWDNRGMVREESWKTDNNGPLEEHYTNIKALLSAPFGQRLKTLRFPFHERNSQRVVKPNIRIESTAYFCPQLTSLTVGIRGFDYTPADTYDLSKPIPLDWIQSVARAVATMPNLSRLEIISPRELQSVTEDGPVYFDTPYVTFATLEDLLENIETRRPPRATRLSELIIYCPLFPTQLDDGLWYRSVTEFLFDSSAGPFHSNLSFVATLADKDSDAADGKYIMTCPQLDRANDALAQADYATLLGGTCDGLDDNGRRSLADNVIATIERMVYCGDLGS